MKTYDSRANLHILRGLERSRIISVATVFRGMFHLILKDLVICLFGRSFMKDFVDGHNICFCLWVLLLQISKANSLNINISLLLSKCEFLHRCLVRQQTCELPEKKEEVFLFRTVYFASLSFKSLMMKKSLKWIFVPPKDRIFPWILTIMYFFHFFSRGVPRFRRHYRKAREKLHWIT